MALTKASVNFLPPRGEKNHCEQKLVASRQMPEGISCYLLLRAAVLDGVQFRAKVFAPIAGVLSRVFSGVFFGVSFRVSFRVSVPVACGG